MLPGGRHAEWGTANAILPIGPSSYLEVIGPDPDGAGKVGLFGISALAEPRLVTWAAKGRNLARLVDQARTRGVELGAVSRGRRERPDGLVLSWELTDPFADRSGGVVPFFIDWGSGAHPAATASGSVKLVGLRAVHPEPRSVREHLATLGVELQLGSGPEPRLIAAFETPAGDVELS